MFGAYLGEILIRTTGTTGLPKAARHDWSVLARTTRDAKPRPGQRWLLAYGPQQFAGIQVLQHVLAIQGTLVAPFPRQPRDEPRLAAGDHTRRAVGLRRVVGIGAGEFAQARLARGILSSLGYADALVDLAPAYMKARVRPAKPSPLFACADSPAVLQADNSTQSALSRSCATSLADR